jgi:hypothetical protein
MVNLYAMKYLTVSLQWMRPREWDPGLVGLALDESAGLDSSWPLEIKWLVHWTRYQWHADIGEVDKAGDAIRWILGHQVRSADQVSWEWEYVWFLAFSLRDVEGARARARIAEGRTPSRLSDGQCSTVLKCRAAIAACEGRFEDASDSAAKALSLAKTDKGYSEGLVRALAFDLDELISSCRNAVHGGCDDGVAPSAIPLEHARGSVKL